MYTVCSSRFFCYWAMFTYMILCIYIFTYIYIYRETGMWGDVWVQYTCLPTICCSVPANAHRFDKIDCTGGKFRGNHESFDPGGTFRLHNCIDFLTCWWLLIDIWSKASFFTNLTNARRAQRSISSSEHQRTHTQPKHSTLDMDMVKQNIQHTLTHKIANSLSSLFTIPSCLERSEAATASKPSASIPICQCRGVKHPTQARRQVFCKHPNPPAPCIYPSNPKTASRM